jgi:hypothetical protein
MSIRVHGFHSLLRCRWASPIQGFGLAKPRPGAGLVIRWHPDTVD